MKPAALLRLYPRAWRERYGDELIALTGSGPLGFWDTADIAYACCVEWSRTPAAGPWLVALLASAAAEGVGRVLRRLQVPPPDAVSHVATLLVVVGIGYLLWRLNEWLFERTAVTGRRLAQVGLVLAVAAGVIGTWTAPSSGHGAVGKLWPIANPAFFWTWLLWSARRLSDRPLA